jgi:hypothetical protein
MTQVEYLDYERGPAQSYPECPPAHFEVPRSIPFPSALMCSLSIPTSSLCTACSRAHVWIDCLFLLPTFMLLCSVLIFNVLCFSSRFTFPFFSSLGFLLCLLLLLFSVCPCVLIAISLCAQCDSVLYVLCHVFVVLLLLPFFFALSLFCLPSLPLGLVSSFFFNHYAQAVFVSFVGVSPGRVPGLKYWYCVPTRKK